MKLQNILIFLSLKLIIIIIKKIKYNIKKFIFTINMKRDFNKNNNNKVITVLVVDEKINQLFIDNINEIQY